MTRFGVLAAAALFAVAGAACSEGVTVPDSADVVEIPRRAWAAQPDGPSFRVLAEEPYTGLREEARLVLASAGEWADVWRRWEDTRSPKTDPPAVDFEQELVVVAALGTRGSGGYGIAIDSVSETSDALVVHVRTARPGALCVVTAALTSPAVAVATPARDKPVRFEQTDYVLTCD